MWVNKGKSVGSGGRPIAPIQFFTSTLDGGNWSVSCLAALLLEKESSLYSCSTSSGRGCVRLCL